MTPSLLFALCAVGLVGIGLIGVVLHRHLLRRVIALNIIGTGVFLMLVALAHRVTDTPADPVPHAMVLTGIVVAVSATALALALIRRLYAACGAPYLPDPDADDEQGNA